MASFLIQTCLIMSIFRECFTTLHKQVQANSRNSTRSILLDSQSPCPQTCSLNRPSAQYPCSNQFPAASSRSRFRSRQLEEPTLKLTGRSEANRIRPRFPPAIHSHLQEDPKRIFTLLKAFKLVHLLIIITNSSRNMCFSNSSCSSKSSKSFSKHFIHR